MMLIMTADNLAAKITQGQFAAQRVLVHQLESFPTRIVVGRGETLVWVADLRQWQTLELVLTPAEQLRRERYKSEQARTQFGITRTLLRLLLSQLLNTPPLTLEITVNPEGKPELLGHDLCFNVSHTDSHAVLAFSRVPVGVDLEVVRNMPSADQLVQRFFEPDEQADYFALPVEQRLRGFFRGWTCKEAVLKGIGCGTRALHRCRVSINPNSPASIVGPSETSERWRIAAWSVSAEVVAAIAIECEQELEVIQLDTKQPS
jgi:4'-phosphopantetheinyl transferase